VNAKGVGWSMNVLRAMVNVSCAKMRGISSGSLLK